MEAAPNTAAPNNGAPNNAERLGIRRKLCPTRKDWIVKNYKLGLTFHSNSDGTQYWAEGIYYELEPQLADALTKAIQELHNLCLKAVDHIVASDDLLRRFLIPENFWPLLRLSWQRRDPNFYGRFDFVLDPNGVPKMLEYNADTPTTLLEAALIQEKWRDEIFPHLDQINGAHKLLVETWKSRFKSVGNTLHVACVKETEEDFRTVEYIRQTAEEAGFEAKFIFMEDIGWNGTEFVDLEERPIKALFKLYPWEWMVIEEPMKIVEPIWKMCLSNKAILPVLWELFLNHPNLLPAYWTREEAEKNIGPYYVEKPLLGREGQNVTIRDASGQFSRVGDYADSGFVYQKTCMPTCIDGNYVVFGGWVVGDTASALGIREERFPILFNQSPFVCHVVTRPRTDPAPTPQELEEMYSRLNPTPSPAACFPAQPEFPAPPITLPLGFYSLENSSVRKSACVWNISSGLMQSAEPHPVPATEPLVIEIPPPLSDNIPPTHTDPEPIA